MPAPAAITRVIPPSKGVPGSPSPLQDGSPGGQICEKARIEENVNANTKRVFTSILNLC